VIKRRILLKGQNLSNTSPTQFAEIRDDIDLFRIQMRFEHFKCRRSVREIATVDREEKTVRVELVHLRENTASRFVEVTVSVSPAGACLSVRSNTKV
jgi:hypothetical protein